MSNAGAGVRAVLAEAVSRRRDRHRQPHAVPGARHQRRVGAGTQRHRHPVLRRARGRLLGPRGAGGEHRARRCRDDSRRPRLHRLRHDDSGPLLPGLGYLDPAQDRRPADAGARHPPAVRGLRLRDANGRRAGAQRHREERPARRLRCALVPDAVFGAHLGSAVRTRSEPAGRRGVRVELAIPTSARVVRRCRRRDGLPRREQRWRAGHPGQRGIR